MLITKKLSTCYLLLLLAVVLILSLPVVADSEVHQRHYLKISQLYDGAKKRPSKRHAQGARVLSMSEAIAIAKRRSNGEVLSAKKSVNRQGKLAYHIKVLSDKGVVRTIIIDAER